MILLRAFMPLAPMTVTILPERRRVAYVIPATLRIPKMMAM